MTCSALAVSGLALTGCTGGGMFNKPNSAVVTVPGGDSYSPDIFLKQGYCPPIQIKPETESLVLYTKGHDGDDSQIRFQGSITDIARECKALGPDTLHIKAGIAGRVTAGPQGGANKVAATLRVAIVKQSDNTVLYTKAFKILATVAAPTYSGDFATVVDDITLKLGGSDRDLVVYVGFDEGRPKKPAT
jgi:hypothetical protein